MSGRVSRFALVSLLGTVVVLISLIYSFRATSMHQLIEHHETHGNVLGRILINSLEHHGLYSILEDPSFRDINGDFQDAVYEQLDGLPVIKLKLYSLDGVVLSSTTPSERGNKADNTVMFRKALDGKVTGLLTFRERIDSTAGPLYGRDIFEVYIPVIGGQGKVEGIIELYTDVTNEMSEMRDDARWLTLFVAALMSLLYILLFLLYYRTDRSLVKEERERQEILVKLQDSSKELEERVRERTEDLEYARFYLQSIIDGIADPVMVIGMDLHVLSKNQAAIDLIPDDADPADHIYCYQITHQLDEPCGNCDHPCTFDHVVKTHQPCKVLHQHKDKDGSLRYVEISSTPIRSIKGNMLGIIEVEHDVTDVITARNRLQEREEQVRAIMDTVTDAIFAFDDLGNIRDLNHSAELLFARSRRDSIGRNASLLFTSEEQGTDFVKTELAPLVSQGVQERVATDVNGDTFPVELWIGKTDLAHGSLYIAVFHDIRSRKAAEQELEQTRLQYFHQEKMAAIGQLAAGILHEVGNPIAAISGSLQAIHMLTPESDGTTDGASFDGDLKGHLKMIDDQIQRLSVITREIADFASPRKQEMELIDLNGLIRSTSNLMRYDKRFEGVDLDLNLDPSIPAIMAVADQLTQIIMNLLLNAIDACEEVESRASRIGIDTKLESGEVHVSVTDNGSGMDKETAVMATEAFFTTKPAGKGTGLGLSLCWSIVNRHHGHAAIETELGTGTTIHLYFPVQQEP